MPLENILEINAAIMLQKRKRRFALQKVVKDFLDKDNPSDISAKLEGDREESLMATKLVVKQNPASYEPFKPLREYLSAVKDKFYSYYTSAKRSIKKAKKSLGYKMTVELEDWGTLFFKPTFKKLVRLNPLGAMARYQEKLWLCITKNVKY